MRIIIGREKEIEELNRRRGSNRPEFIAVYGRRRVGKTFLINETLGDYMTFHHTGLSPYDRKKRVTLK
ncbi:MAG: ATP-binding protein, partial [Bacteroidales bacterium]|nr:ATP-binding protein [Bacteroidales bacterium]